MTKRIEITFEIERRFVVRRRSRQRTSVFCKFCQKESELLSTDEAALTSNRSSRTIFHWVERGRLHFTETNDGILLVCQRSLDEVMNSREES